MRQQHYWYGWFTADTKTNAEVVGHIGTSALDSMLCGATIPEGATLRTHHYGRVFMTMKFGSFCPECEALVKVGEKVAVRA